MFHKVLFFFCELFHCCLYWYYDYTEVIMMKNMYMDFRMQRWTENCFFIATFDKNAIHQDVVNCVKYVFVLTPIFIFTKLNITKCFNKKDVERIYCC